VGLCIIPILPAAFLEVVCSAVICLVSKRNACYHIDEKVLEVGPLASVFPCSQSRILDHMVTMRGFDYSISDMSRASGVGLKTALGIVHDLAAQGVIFKTRSVGKANMFKLNLESMQAKSISKLAFEIAKKRAHA